MSVERTLQEALQSLPDREAAEEAQLWVCRVEVLLEWILQHPKLVEVRHEAARLLTDLRGEDVLEPPPNRKV
ncbi:MAG: hypothetical protein KatS3mg077_0584 [Candidatus Binatia bacterium]|nr:MAG: hypothetical protein KatS3mg077_0584 [Candidatus Binatia bacterium]